jgi:hypothetical protein
MSDSLIEDKCVTTGREKECLKLWKDDSGSVYYSYSYSFNPNPNNLAVAGVSSREQINMLPGKDLQNDVDANHSYSLLAKLSIAVGAIAAFSGITYVGSAYKHGKTNEISPKDFVKVSKAFVLSSVSYVKNTSFEEMAENLKHGTIGLYDQLKGTLIYITDEFNSNLLHITESLGIAGVGVVKAAGAVATAATDHSDVAE